MKFSLRNRQESTYLKKADEILIEWRDRKALPDYAEKYPEAALVLEVPPAQEWEMAEIKEYSILSRGKLTLSLPEMTDPRIAELKANNIPFFWGYSVSTWWELDALIALGVSQVRIEAPLFFETKKLQQKCYKKVALRAVANVAHEGYLPGVDGITGSWIRPEDVEQYEKTFTTIEFRDCDNSKEQALYRIYAEQHEWPGQVEMLITNISAPGKYNRMLPPEFTQHRLNCGQRCKSGGACRICHRYMHLADPELIKNYMETTNHN